MLGLGLRGLSLGQRGGSGEPPIITATVDPVLTALTDAQTPADGFTSGTYTSTAGTISSEVAAYLVNGSPEASSYDLTAGDTVRVSETVTDSEGNSRVFWTATQVVQSTAVDPPVAAGGLADQTWAQHTAITPLDVSLDFTGSGITYALSPSSAALPTGLSLSSAGVISGTPTATVTGAAIIIRGTNSGGYDDSAFSLTVSVGSYAPNMGPYDFTTAQDLRTFGAYWLRPYDLENSFGATGAALAAANGRYVWFVSSDHYSTTDYDSGDGGGIRIGFSDDPGVLPEAFEITLWHTQEDASISGDWVQTETPWLVYNPDDATGKVFYLYAHGNSISDAARGQDTFLYRSDDLATWEFVGVSHLGSGTSEHTGYQSVFRNGTGDWESFGLGYTTSTLQGRWTSTDGVTFSIDTEWVTASELRNDYKVSGRGERIDIGGQTYIGATLENSTVTPVLKQFALVPVDSDFKATATAFDDRIQLSQEYESDYPWFNHTQGLQTYAEDGVFHVYTNRGFYLDQGDDATNRNTLVDYYAYVYDATAAAQAAPVSVTATCSAGVVTVSCKAVLPQNTYRLERAASDAGPWSLVADGGNTITDSSPTTDAVNYYRLTTLESGVARKSRIVSTYVSSASAFVNQHLTRLSRKGWDLSTVDVAYVSACMTWLENEGLASLVLRWVSPSFGVSLDGSDRALEIGDIVSTLKPHWGDDARPLGDTLYAGKYSADLFGAGLPGIYADTSDGYSQSYSYLAGYGRANLNRHGSAITIAEAFTRKGTQYTGGGFAYTSRDRGAFFRRDYAGNTMTAGRSFATYYASQPITNDTSYVALATAVVAEDDGLVDFSFSLNDGAAVTAENVDIADPISGTRQVTDDPMPVFTIGRPASVKIKDFVVTSDVPRSVDWFADGVAFACELSAAQITSLNNLLKPRVGLSPAVTSLDIQADYGAVGDGVTDDSAAFAAFGTDNAGSTTPIALAVPAGSYPISGMSAVHSLREVGDIEITGDVDGGGAPTSAILSQWAVGSGGVDNVPTKSVRLNAVTAGDTTLTVKAEDPAYVATEPAGNYNRTLAELTGLFEVGDMAMIACNDLMGYGYPPNPATWEFVRITGVNTSTGAITVSAPVSWDYPDDLPHYASGAYDNGGVWASNGVDHGGPATLYALVNWDKSVTMNNIEIDSNDQWVMGAREIEMNNCVHLGTYFTAPSASESTVFNGGSFYKFEVDKMLTSLEMNNVEITNRVECQSPVPTILTMNGCTAPTAGTGFQSVITNCDIDTLLYVGPTGYGAGKSLSISNSAVGGVALSVRTNAIDGAVISGGTISGIRRNVFDQVGSLVVGETLTGGTSGATATIAAIDGQAALLGSLSGSFVAGETVSSPSLTSGTLGVNHFGRGWAVVGSTACLKVSAKTVLCAEVLDFYADGQYNTVVLDATAIPTISEGTVTDVFPHPCPDMTVSGCTGGEAIGTMDGMPANTPAGSWAKFTLNSDGSAVTTGTAMWGKVVSYTVNVSKAYTGALGSLTVKTAQFGWQGINIADGDTAKKFLITVDLKTTGERVYSASAPTGVQAGDTQAAYEFSDCSFYVATPGDIQPYLSADISGEDPSVWPEFTITLVLDQSFNMAE